MREAREADRLKEEARLARKAKKALANKWKVTGGDEYVPDTYGGSISGRDMVKNFKNYHEIVDPKSLMPQELTKVKSIIAKEQGKTKSSSVKKRKRGRKLSPDRSKVLYTGQS